MTKAELRAQLESDVAAFVAAGGGIQQCAPGPVPSRFQRVTGRWQWAPSAKCREIIAREPAVGARLLEIMGEESAIQVPADAWATLYPDVRLVSDEIRESGARTLSAALEYEGEAA